MTILLAALLLAAQTHSNPLNQPAEPPPVPPTRTVPPRRVQAPQTAPDRPADPARERAALCQAEVRRDANAGLALANQWQSSGGGLDARQCAGLAHVALEQWAEAGTIYEQAAQQAANINDVRAADFWVQAGNAWIAGGELPRAIAAFDAGLAVDGIGAELRGEMMLDRARARVAGNNLTAARGDVDQALQMVPGDPMAWYLSAGLALRQQDMTRARADIGRARTMAATDPDVLLLAGTVAGRGGDMDEAVRLYREVVRIAPASDAGRQAAQSLETLREVEVPATAPSPATPAPTPTPQSR